MNKYRNSKVYKIVNSHNDEIYVGSTCNELRWRWAAHKADWKMHNAGTKKSKRTLHRAFSEIGIENFRIILVESLACNNKYELLHREDYWIRTLKPKYNKNCAYTGICGPIDLRQKPLEEVVVDDIAEGDYVCIACNKNYASKMTLKKHLNTRKHHLELEEYNFDIEMDRLGCDITLFD